MEQKPVRRFQPLDGQPAKVRTVTLCAFDIYKSEVTGKRCGRIADGQHQDVAAGGKSRKRADAIAAGK